jgi:hypothetical protein
VVELWKKDPAGRREVTEVVPLGAVSCPGPFPYFITLFPDHHDVNCSAMPFPP